MSLEREATAVRSIALRQDLKQWEKQFVASNNGRRASREEIKADVEITAKYKEYYKLRDIVSGKLAPAVPLEDSRKRKAGPAMNVTPSKRNAGLLVTPRKDTRVSKAQFTFYTSPNDPNEDSAPIITRTFIGPTPQKDGRVLGIFDLLPVEVTPTKSNELSRTILGGLPANSLLTTQSKTRPYSNLSGQEQDLGKEDNGPMTAHKHSRTPQSAGKRFLLDSFVTPLKRKHACENAATPTSTSNSLGFSTPAFLRRHSQPAFTLTTVIEDGEEGDVSAAASPSVSRCQAPGLKRRTGSIRTLSSMIADIRRQEDEALDEEMDIMDEMERGGTVEGPVNKRAKLRQESVLVEDSQATTMLGPDGTGETSEDEDAPMGRVRLGKDGKPWVYSKKGQKRQTKRVTMQPTGRPKPKHVAQTPFSSPDTDHTDEYEEKVPTVHETQLAHPNGNPDDEYVSEPDSLADPKRRLKISSANGTERCGAVPTEPAKSKTSSFKAGNNDGVVAKTAKKISAAAHANFRKLKIRGKGSAGEGGRGKYFSGRGRR